jgi:hypothetical protein
MFDPVPLSPVATLFDYACTGSGLSQIVSGVRSAWCVIGFPPFAEGAVQGELTGGTRPGVFIEGEAVVFDPSTEVSAQMTGRLDYQVAVEQLRAVPAHPGSLIHQLTASFDAEDTGRP